MEVAQEKAPEVIQKVIVAFVFEDTINEAGETVDAKLIGTLRISDEEQKEEFLNFAKRGAKTVIQRQTTQS